MKVAILVSKVTEAKFDPVELLAEQQTLETVREFRVMLKTLNHEVKVIRLDNNFYAKIRKNRPDVILNLCDSFSGPSTLESAVPAVLEMLRIPYTGCGMLPLSICINKARTKDILTANEIPNPRYKLFTKKDKTFEHDLQYPLIVKPNAEDASIGIRRNSVVNDKKQLIEKVTEVLTKYGQDVIIEEYIEGREFDAHVLGDQELTVLPVAEKVFKNFPAGEYKIFDYETKWVEDDVRDIDAQFPAKISPELTLKIQETAKQVYRTLCLDGYGRVELRVKDDIPYIIEVNPNPEFKKGELFMKIANKLGYKDEEFLQLILDIAINNKRNRR